MPLTSALSLMPPQTGSTPAERWEQARRHGAKLRKELRAHAAQVKAGQATKAELLAYIKGPLELREDNVEKLLHKQERATIAGATAFSVDVPPPPHQTSLSRRGKWLQAVRYLERLRLHHNIRGKRFRDGLINETQWLRYKSTVFYPRFHAAHAFLRGHEGAYDAEA